MDIIKLIMSIIELVFIAIGVIMIFDARRIASKWFSFGEKNESAKVLKIVGLVICIIVGIIFIKNI